MQTQMRLLVFALIAVVAAGTVDYEWAGIFKTPEDSYVWTAQKTKGKYADPEMAIVLLPAAATTDAALDALKADGASAINMTCTTVTSGQTMTPAANKCYTLSFNQQLHTSSFAINATQVSNIAIFAQHFPTEFERNTHYIQDDHGDDIEPVHELPEEVAAAHDDHDDKPWGATIGAAVLVNICTLIGVFFAIPCFAALIKDYPETVFALANAFAAGALLAAAFYLMLYEATHLIVYTKEATATAYWGSMIICGFLVATIVEITISTVYHPEDASLAPSSAPAIEDSSSAPTETAGITTEELPVPEATESGQRSCVSDGRSCAGSGNGSGNGAEHATKEVAKEGEVVVELAEKAGNGNGEIVPAASFDPSQRMRILSGVLIGDFLHNLVDGIVIGAAFLGCSTSVAWGITGATIAHEIAQEIADFLVLTDPSLGALTVPYALLFNFLSGTSVILGAIIILAQDSIDSKSQGFLLAFGGGVYIQIAASECMPRVHKMAQTVGLKFASLAVFILGVFCIGIILTVHEHCVPEGGGGGHEGHGH